VQIARSIAARPGRRQSMSCLTWMSIHGR
jgi:hypothetical protein